MREHKVKNQSEANKTFEKKRHVNKINEQAETSPNNNAIKFKPQKELPLRNLQTLQTSSAEEMDREYFHWGATAEIMEIIRRREKSPETKRLVERRIEIARPGMMRRRYDQNAQKTTWVPSRPNERRREEIAEIDGELIQRTNRLGGGYQPMQVAEQIPNEIQAKEQPMEDRTNDSESEKIVKSSADRGNNLPIVDLKNYNTDGKEAHYVQINQSIGAITEGKKLAAEIIEKEA